MGSAQDGESLDSLFQLAYDELRRAAHGMAGGAGRTLQPTALVHDAFLKLEGSGLVPNGKQHFLAIAAGAMRQVLQDHARAKRTLKRGAGQRAVTLNEDLLASGRLHEDALLLDEALSSLTKVQPEGARVAELRLLAGMTNEEVAQVLQVSTRKVQLDWRAARAWLRQRLGPKDESA